MKDKKKNRMGKQLARLIGIPLGGVAGYWLGVLALHIFRDVAESITPLARGLILASSALLFAAIFWLSAPAFCGWLMNLGYALEKSVSKYNAKDFAAGGLGLIGGLFVAFLISDILKLIPIYALSATLIILLYVLFGLIGMVLGAKKLGEIIIVRDKTAERPPGTLKLLDSSAIIDGRILELAKTGFLDGTFVVPDYILSELRTVADSADELKRARGRRGLDIVADMQRTEGIRVIVSEEPPEEGLDTDAKLLKSAEKLRAKVVTTDYNLNKAAKIMGITVLNVNDLAGALRPAALPGEQLRLELVKTGKDPAQGVGYLADGTMVVVENGGGAVGKRVVVTVTTSLQTAAGRMIFARLPE